MERERERDIVGFKVQVLELSSRRANLWPGPLGPGAASMPRRQGLDMATADLMIEPIKHLPMNQSDWAILVAGIFQRFAH